MHFSKLVGERMVQKSVIFGAGLYGKVALEKLGEDEVEYFIDNSQTKQGTMYLGKRVIGLQQFMELSKQYHIVVASVYASSIVKQLKDAGITNYSIFIDYLHGYYETDELIVNPYELTPEVSTEEEWQQSERNEYMKKAVYDEAELLFEKQPLFHHIEVETINRCNGVCSFCPVNRNVDPRKEAIMSEEMFYNIVEQLAEIDYSGRFTTFSNNEPLLDDRIIEWNRYAREKLPKARMHLFTNGTLLTLEKFVALTEILDELIIDNYQQELKLIKPCQEIQRYCEEHPELKKKVTIVLRKPKEILTSRGGDAPNRQNLADYGKERCVLPYKQIIVRPDGKISLCCNDALGKYTLGDLSRERLLDIWYGPRFQMVRKCLYEGRENWGNCRFCDNFSVG